MLTRVLALALSSVIAVALLGGTAPAEQVPAPGGGDLTYDDYLAGHLSYPGVERGERLLARQEKLARRPSARPVAAVDSAYGRPGCTTPPELEVGAEREFFVIQSQAGNRQITAVLAAKSPHGYMWVQKEFYAGAAPSAPEGGFVTQAEAEEGLVDWENIYDVDRSYFGRQPAPDTPAQNLPPGLPADWRDADCDPHISILNFPIDAGTSLGFIAGYFSSEHEYPNGTGEHESPFSNETEMFFMNSLYLNVGDDTYAGVLAHEFFHMIQFSNDYNEETWVNEGMADIAAVVNGFGDIVEGHVSAYEGQPDNHLFDWGSEVEDYGQAFLFLDYLFNHYGAPEVTSTERREAYGLAKLLTRTPQDGLEGVTKVVRGRSPALLRKLDRYYRSGDFQKVFRDYLVANFLDLPEASHGQFGYANRDVNVASAGTGDRSPDDSTVHAYGGEYYELTGPGKFSTTAEDPVPLIPASQGQPPPTPGKLAWSNRADEMITWLERGADLTEATAPQLRFKYWYQIEEDWDYAYVRVSQDNGASYDYVPTADCGGKPTDPNGNNRAITGSGGITGDSGGWQDCTLDLTPYAGGPVLIRFEYDTDQAVTEPGYVVDNVDLIDGETKLWNRTKFEKRARGWSFGGDGIKKWMRLRPSSKNRPLVQVVTVSGDDVHRVTRTRRHYVRNNGDLALGVPVGITGGKTIVIFSGTTPIATDPYGYTYQVDR